MRTLKYIKFISKPNEWYKEGTEAFLDDEPPIHRITIEDFEAYKVKNNGCNSGCFVGLRVCEITYGKPEWVDGEFCCFDEFDIIETDEYLEFKTTEELEKFYENTKI